MSKMECFQALAPHFPLIRMRGKRPIEKNWPELGKECRGFNEIGFQPEDNAGIVTGSASDLLVVDIDIPHRFFKARDAGILSIPVNALTIFTGSGKAHIYFQYPIDGITMEVDSLGNTVLRYWKRKCSHRTRVDPPEHRQALHYSNSWANSRSTRLAFGFVF